MRFTVKHGIPKSKSTFITAKKNLDFRLCTRDFTDWVLYSKLDQDRGKENRVPGLPGSGALCGDERWPEGGLPTNGKDFSPLLVSALLSLTPKFSLPLPFLLPPLKTTPAAQRWFSLETERTRAHSPCAAPRRFATSPFVSSSLFVASAIVVNEREGEGGLSQGWAKEGKTGLGLRGNKERKKGPSPEKKERKISKRGWA